MRRNYLDPRETPTPAEQLDEAAAHLTCSHQSAGLCPACRADFDTDPDAWLEFGEYPQGRANWAALQAEMAAEPPSELPMPPDDDGIPF